MSRLTLGGHAFRYWLEPGGEEDYPRARCKCRWEWEEGPWATRADARRAYRDHILSAKYPPLVVQEGTDT